MPADSTGEGTVRLSMADGVASILINRPKRLNTLTTSMVAELRRQLDEVRAGPARVAVLEGAGGVFCAGRDLREAEEGEDARAIVEEVFNPLILSVAQMEIPTVAAVEGACLGAGLGLALACDLVVAEAGARLGSPYRRLGAVLDAGLHRFMMERIGKGRMLELVYTGRLVSGADAGRIGLVDRVARGADEFLSEKKALSQLIASGPTLAFKESKTILHQMEPTSTLVDVLSMEAMAQGRASQSEDYREGFSAFGEKRRPVFRGR